MKLIILFLLVVFSVTNGLLWNPKWWNRYLNCDNQFNQRVICALANSNEETCKCEVPAVECGKCDSVE